ncbi:MAG: rhodanese-like domain-containing protein [Deltaproteobacteria bacterium]|nr:MAG: rhodanese-like domain-containing protein [Deltaproteobacteria bacterium]
MTPAAAAAALARLRVIDVREPDEYHGDLGHLPGAALVPLARLDAELHRFDAEQPVLVVCRSGRRSAAACERLASAGVRRVYNLAGGMLAWNADGREVCARRHDAARGCDAARGGAA